MPHDYIDHSETRERVDLNFTIQPEGDNKLLLVFKSREISEDFTLDIGVGGITGINTNLNSAVSLLIREANPSTRQLGERSLQSLLLDLSEGLAYRGFLAKNNIFGAEATPLIEDAVTALPKDHDPRFEIVSDVFLIPWECLFEIHPTELDENLPLEDIVGNFWAMKYIVSRRPNPKNRRNVNERKEPVLRLISPLRIGVIINNELEYAQRELMWFREQAALGWIELIEFPYHPSWESYEFVKEFNIFISRTDLDVLHFACEAIYEGEDGLSSKFVISSKHEYQINFLNDKPKIQFKAPIIFLNACDTGVRNPDQTFDFIRMFRQKGGQNIIAVESSLNSRVGEAIAETFYENLTSAQPLGNALLKARWEVIRGNSGKADICALFYAMYADSCLVIEY
jgi:hypothetical protein